MRKLGQYASCTLRAKRAAGIPRDREAIRIDPRSGVKFSCSRAIGQGRLAKSVHRFKPRRRASLLTHTIIELRLQLPSITSLLHRLSVESL